MAPVTPSGVPSQLIAGDTLLFTVSYGDFPVSEGWTLSMSLVGATTLQTEAGEITEDDGTTWTVTIPAARTRTLAASPGVYRWFHYMTGSGSYAGRRYTVAEGRLEVVQNPADAADGDFQSQYETELVLVQAEIKARLMDSMKAYTIRGRQAVLEELRDLRAQEAKIKRELWKLRNSGQAMPVLQRVYHGP